MGRGIQRHHSEQAYLMDNLPCRTHPLQGNVEVLTAASPSLGQFVFVLPEKQMSSYPPIFKLGSSMLPTDRWGKRETYGARYTKTPQRAGILHG